MDRRSFIFTLAAAAATPAMSITAPAAITGATARRYANAKIIAQAHNACSPAMLQRLLHVDAGVAVELNAMLLRRGVITAAGSDGIAMAMNPTNTNCVPTQALKPTNLSKTVVDMREKVRAFVEDAEEVAETEPELATVDTPENGQHAS